MSERRGTVRHRTLKGGHIVLNHENSTIDCLVRDLSDSGARLKVASLVGIPDRFDLVIDSEQTIRACMVRWRKEGTIGVSFDPAGPRPLAPGAHPKKPDVPHRKDSGSGY